MYNMIPITSELTVEGFHSIYYFEFGKNFNHPPESHDFWELVYVDSGEIIAITEDVAKSLGQGSLIFHSPGEKHAHVSNKLVSNNMLVITFTASGEAMRFFQKRVFNLGKSEKTLLSLFKGEATRILGILPNDYNDKNPIKVHGGGAFQLLGCYLTELLLLLKRSEEAEVVTQKAEERILAKSSTAELICAYLEENVYSALSLDDVCRKFYMGKSKLCKLFSDYLNQSPMSYYSGLKIKEAKRLLHEGVAVSKISDMLGFASVHNFSRAFKNSSGASPLEYKRKSLK